METRGPKSLITESAILVGLERAEERALFEPPLTELTRLAETAGAVVVDRVIQRLDRIVPSTYVGKGKANEIAELAKALGADVVIFDHDLRPAQGRNLEKILGCRVVDRSELILDIFATRAQSRQARVQVELAQLEYLRPRLRRMWTHLSRMEGGVGAGGPIGMRGPGEKQIEVDRRIVNRRIHGLRKELKEIERQQHTRSAARRKFFSVSLVGYTNAGKSTLLRALTGAEILIENRLFATLDTTTRAWSLGGGKRVFLSDTVGFIRGLPHHLVASFQATLEEAREADLLLNVVDAGNPDADSQMRTVTRVLDEVGIGKIPQIRVLNKIDLVEDRMRLSLLGQTTGTTVALSASTGEGVEDLSKAVRAEIERSQVEVEISVHPGNGRLLALLAEKGTILSREYVGDEEVRIQARLPRRYAETLRSREEEDGSG